VLILEDDELVDVETAVLVAETALAYGSTEETAGLRGGGGGGLGGGVLGAAASPLSAPLLYAALGLDVTSATSEGLRKRWLILSRLLHPDQVSRRCGEVGQEGLENRATEAFKVVTNAYRALKGVV
jgi:hypothetical protein